MSDIRLTQGMHLPKKENKRSSSGAKTKSFVRDLADSSIRETYSMRTGFFMTLILAALLWWVPVLGPMVAGYVGGRKSGTTMRGLASSSLAALTIIALWFVLSLGMFSGQSISNYLTTLAVGSVFEPAVQYIASLFMTVGSTSSISLEPLFMMAVFGMIGGFMANQVRKEAEMMAVAGSASQTRRVRSLDLYMKGKKTGFESFDDCSAICVNAMPPSEPVAKAPAPVPEVQTKQSAVTTTAEMRVATTSTTSEPADDVQAATDNPFAGLVARSAKREDQEKPAPGKDFEYI